MSASIILGPSRTSLPRAIAYPSARRSQFAIRARSNGNLLLENAASAEAEVFADGVIGARQPRPRRRTQASRPHSSRAYDVSMLPIIPVARIMSRISASG